MQQSVIGGVHRPNTTSPEIYICACSLVPQIAKRRRNQSQQFRGSARMKHPLQISESLALLRPDSIQVGPPVTVILARRGEDCIKRILLRDPRSMKVFPQPPDLNSSEDTTRDIRDVQPVPDAIISSEASEWDMISGQMIFCAGSLAKQVIFLLFRILLKKGLLTILKEDMSARDAFNLSTVAQSEVQIPQFRRDPALKQLPIHYNAFAPVNRFVFSPDGDFVASDDELIRTLSEVTENWLKTTNSANESSYAYSNLNIVVLALIIVRSCKEDIDQLAQQHLFGPLGMTRTYLGSNQQHEDSNMAQGFRMAGDLTTFFRTPVHDYASNVAAQVSVGFWTCTDDLSKLYQAVIDGYHEDEGVIDNEIAHAFLAASVKMKGEKPDISPAGYVSKYPKQQLGRDSLNRVFDVDEIKSSSARSVFSKLRTKLIHNKGGTADGFTCSMYLCLEEKLVVIVFCNCTGPFDLSEPMARCILEEQLYGRPPLAISHEIQDLLKSSCAKWRQLEQEVLERDDWDGDLLPFVGSFRDDVTGRSLYIETHKGQAVICRRDEVLYCVPIGVQGNRMRFFPRSQGLFVDRLSYWSDLTFELQWYQGGARLVGNGGAEIYIRQ